MFSFAVVLPPLGVFLERGCNADFFINILLTILGYMCVALILFVGLASAPILRNHTALLTFRPLLFLCDISPGIIHGTCSLSRIDVKADLTSVSLALYIILKY